MIGLIVGALGRTDDIYTYIPTAELTKLTTWADNAGLVGSFTEGFVQTRKLTTAIFKNSSGSVNLVMKSIPR